MATINTYVVLILLSTTLFYGCGSGSKKASYSDVNISAEQKITLYKALDKSVQIIDSQSKLDKLYDDINRSREGLTGHHKTSYEKLTVDFSKDTLLFIQRQYTSYNTTTTIKPQHNGVRVYSTAGNSKYHLKLGTLIVLKNGRGIPLLFTKISVIGSCGASGGFLKGDSPTVNLTNATLLHSAKSSLNTSNRPAYTMFGDSSVDKFYQTHFQGIAPAKVKWIDDDALSSGVIYSDSSTSFLSPKLTDAWNATFHHCDADVKYPMNVWNFSIEGFRSDCAEYDASEEPKISLYSVPYHTINPDFIGSVEGIQSISVKSCTPYVSTPKKEDTDWLLEHYTLEKITFKDIF